jgi:hypothetical protein
VQHAPIQPPRAPGSNECGACVVAMLTDRTKEEVLEEVGDTVQPDYFWLRFMSNLGFVLENVRDDPEFDTRLAWNEMFNGYLNLPLGNRYYCSIRTDSIVHAVAVDEAGMVLDPSTGAPESGRCTLGEYLRWNQNRVGMVAIACCYRVGPRAG